MATILISFLRWGGGNNQDGAASIIMLIIPKFTVKSVNYVCMHGVCHVMALVSTSADPALPSQHLLQFPGYLKYTVTSQQSADILSWSAHRLFNKEHVSVIQMGDSER
jgi:hypothetical protein